MAEVAKECSLKPVSFEPTKGLTKGQQAIYDMLVNKATKGEILTRGDIVDCYLNIETRWYRTWNYNAGNGRSHYQATSKRELLKTDYETKGKALMWFKSNLATCIIKGKILAIPIIEDI